MRRAARALLTLAILSSVAWAGKRDALVKEFLAYLTAQKLAHTVLEQTDDTLVLQVGEAKPSLALDNMEKHLADEIAGGSTPAAARAWLFEHYAGMLREMAKLPRPLGLKEDGPFLLPRLVAPDYLASMKDILHQPLGRTGLHVAWVRDGEGSVRYLMDKDLKDLGLTLAALDALARQNLSKITPMERLRAGLKEVVAMNHGDSFDAARLLLVPSVLKPGEAMQAAVPDRDLLILAPVPTDGDWTTSRAAAKRAVPGEGKTGVPALLDRPVLITRDGYELR